MGLCRKKSQKQPKARNLRLASTLVICSYGFIFMYNGAFCIFIIRVFICFALMSHFEALWVVYCDF